MGRPYDDILREDYFRPIMPRLRASDFDLSLPPSEIALQWTLHRVRPSNMLAVEQLALKLWEPDMADRLVDQVEEGFRHRNQRNAPRWFAITSGNVLAGFTGIRESWMVPKGAECIGIDVDPEYQGLGFGHLLNQARLEYAKACGSTYAMVCTIKPGWFESEGFKVLDVTSPRGETWYVMRKEL